MVFNNYQYLNPAFYLQYKTQLYNSIWLACRESCLGEVYIIYKQLGLSSDLSCRSENNKHFSQKSAFKSDWICWLLGYVGTHSLVSDSELKSCPKIIHISIIV